MPTAFSDEIQMLAATLISLLPLENRDSPELLFAPESVNLHTRRKFSRHNLAQFVDSLKDRSQIDRTITISNMIIKAVEVRSTRGKLADRDIISKVYIAADRAFSVKHDWNFNLYSHIDECILNITLRHALVVSTTLTYYFHGVSDPQASAGRELGLSEPEISRIFRSVEKKLGFTMRSRTGRGPAGGVTEIGRRLYPYFLEIAMGASFLASSYLPKTLNPDENHH